MVKRNAEIGKSSVSEYEGFKIGDSVKLKIEAVPTDHTAKIVSFNKSSKTFKVLLKSKLKKDAQGVWGPIYLNELIHA